MEKAERLYTEYLLSPTERFEQLYTDYSQNKISLQDFQLRLESLMGSYDFLFKDDEKFIKSVINSLELIIYTLPDELQKTKVDSLYPKILCYSKSKNWKIVKTFQNYRFEINL